ncbi:MAG: hypothetical protein ACRD7E_21260, partial [Bryobacteraceae bacterium]
VRYGPVALAQRAARTPISLARIAACPRFRCCPDIAAQRRRCAASPNTLIYIGADLGNQSACLDLVNIWNRAQPSDQILIHETEMLGDVAGQRQFEFVVLAS